LYGDVFRKNLIETEIEAENIDVTLWGKMEEPIYMDLPQMKNESNESKEIEEEIEDMEEEEEEMSMKQALPPLPKSKPPSSVPSSFIDFKPKDELDLRK
jgi:hypothetical protein